MLGVPPKHTKARTRLTAKQAADFFGKIVCIALGITFAAEASPSLLRFDSVWAIALSVMILLIFGVGIGVTSWTVVEQIGGATHGMVARSVIGAAVALVLSHLAGLPANGMISQAILGTFLGAMIPANVRWSVIGMLAGVLIGESINLLLIRWSGRLDVPGLTMRATSSTLLDAMIGGLVGIYLGGLRKRPAEPAPPSSATPQDKAQAGGEDNSEWMRQQKSKNRRLW